MSCIDVWAGGKTQIIFFTHHQHIVAFAEKSVLEEILHVRFF